MSDELHEHAASYTRLSYTKADWRNVMLKTLPEDLPINQVKRFEIYEKAGIPESVYKDLDPQVLHLALRARFPGERQW